MSLASYMLRDGTLFFLPDIPVHNSFSIATISVTSHVTLHSDSALSGSRQSTRLVFPQFLPMILGAKRASRHWLSLTLTLLLNLTAILNTIWARLKTDRRICRRILLSSNRMATPKPRVKDITEEPVRSPHLDGKRATVGRLQGLCLS
ncbi:hypothetical protein BD309DRAFT_574055 [Dichomitus squalens]|nr:hypothetical protein BD309DRAFT_574055 [Dichomitus squalens]